MDHFDLTTTQLTGAWRTMCAGAPGYQHRSADGVEYIFSGLPIAFFNVAIVTARRRDSRGAGRRRPQCDARGPAAQQVPWMFIVTHDALEDGVDATQTLDAAGLAPMMPLTGMLATTVSPSASLPGGLQLEVPQDDERCADVLNVNALAYGMDLEAGQSLMAKRSFWASHVPVVGSVDGKARLQRRGDDGRRLPLRGARRDRSRASEARLRRRRDASCAAGRRRAARAASRRSCTRRRPGVRSTSAWATKPSPGTRCFWRRDFLEGH